MKDFRRDYGTSEKLEKPAKGVPMRPGETVMEMTERHVRKGEFIVAGQTKLIGRLDELGLPTKIAEELLAQCQRSQAFHVQHLSKLKEKNPTLWLP